MTCHHHHHHHHIITTLSSYYHHNQTQQTQAPANRNTRSKQWQLWLAACQRKRFRFLRFSFTQRTQRKRLRLNGNRAWVWSVALCCDACGHYGARSALSCCNMSSIFIIINRFDAKQNRFLISVSIRSKVKLYCLSFTLAYIMMLSPSNEQVWVLLFYKSSRLSFSRYVASSGENLCFYHHHYLLTYFFLSVLVIVSCVYTC